MSTYMFLFELLGSLKNVCLHLSSQYASETEFCICFMLVSAIGQECLGHSLGPVLLVVSPHRRFSNRRQCCDQASPCGSYQYYKMDLSNNHQGTLKKVLSLTNPGGCTAHPRSYSGKSWVERRRALTWSSAFVGVKGGVPRILWVYFLLVNLKPKNRN